MKRRILTLCVTFALLFSLSGCFLTIPVKQETPTPEESTVDPTAYLAEFRDGWCYRMLPAHLQEMYGALYTAVRDCEEDESFTIRGEDGADHPYTGIKVSLPHPITDTADARTVFNAFTTDNPHFYFLGNTYSYEGYRLDGTDYYDTFYLTFVMDAATRREAAEKLETAVGAFLASVPKGADEYATELHLHDKLINHVEYDRTAADTDAAGAMHATAFSAYGALVEGRAVCEGYSRAMQLLLHRADIPCTLVSGTADGAAHMWNVVAIDGLNYHLDPTWNDAGNRLQHTFFNLHTAAMLKTHTPSADILGVDTCTATEANFYVKENAYLDTDDRSIIAEAVARQVADGKELIDLQFSESTYAAAQQFIADMRRLQQYTNPFLEGETLWDYVCLVNDEHGTLTLHKEK